MTDYLLAALILWSVFWDSARDKENNSKNKWPNSGWRLCNEKKGRTPFVMPRGLFWLDPGTSSFQHEAKTVITVDKWHLYKWMAFYPPLVYIWTGLWPAWGMMIAISLLSILAWRLWPKPDHWE